MKLASLLLPVLVSVAACSGSNGSSTGAPPTTAPAPAPAPAPVSSVLSADGKHFAAERVYEGNCAPAGSRGGCYTLTLRPDGTMTYFMLDAGVEGTYEIQGDKLLLSPSGGNLEPFTLSSDYARANDLPLKQ